MDERLSKQTPSGAYAAAGYTAAGDSAADGSVGMVERHEQALSDEQLQWLEPLGAASTAAARCLYVINYVAMRVLFRLRVRGAHRLPRQGPFILTPNHASSLDPMAIAAAVSFRMLSNTYWAGWAQPVLRTPLRRAVNRLARVVPIERDHSSLTVAAAVLERGHNLVWFPEGHRTEDGELQQFKRGIGILLENFAVPAVPVHVDGTFQAMPPDGRLPRRLARITVTFGRPRLADELAAGGDADAIAEKLRECVAELQPHN
jgi:long-chain acyl-CoA synthetase